jgi:hypothetical protein
MSKNKQPRQRAVLTFTEGNDGLRATLEFQPSIKGKTEVPISAIVATAAWNAVKPAVEAANRAVKEAAIHHPLSTVGKAVSSHGS